MALRHTNHNQKMRVAITGAQSYTGRYVSQILLKRNASILNLTNHKRQWGIHSASITDTPLKFDRQHLVNSLRGCQALVQTYWVRFDNQLGISRNQATDNSKMLIDCARQAGVKKIVYTSHTQTSLNSPFPYIREKANVEEHLKRSGLGWGIVKPCGIFGRTPSESIVINNMAFMARLSPLFPMPGDGSYRFQMVHVQDMAELIVNCLDSEQNIEVDAVGPDDLTFKELVKVLSKELSTVCYPVTGVPKSVCTALTQPVNWYFKDILVDKNDLGLMTSGLTCSLTTPPGKRSLVEWIHNNKDTLGKQWVSSVKRYYK